MPQGPKDVSSAADVHSDYTSSGRIGHSASIQTTSRLDRGSSRPTALVYPKGTAIPVRADFNTLDNPFCWSVNPDEIGELPGGRRALRRLQPDGRRLPPQPPRDGRHAAGGTIAFPPRDRNQGFNSILPTTHRQNFLVPPRRHRSFPLAEL